MIRLLLLIAGLFVCLGAAAVLAKAGHYWWAAAFSIIALLFPAIDIYGKRYQVEGRIAVTRPASPL